MARKFVHISAIAAITLATLSMSAPAFAVGTYGDARSELVNYGRFNNDLNVDYRNGSSLGFDDDDDDDGRRFGRGDRRFDRDDRRFDRDDRRFNRNDRRFRGQRCKSGTTGTILGGVVGGLLGREIGRGRFNQNSGTTGLILGAGAGALAGRAIEKSGSRC